MVTELRFDAKLANHFIFQILCRQRSWFRLWIAEYRVIIIRKRTAGVGSGKAPESLQPVQLQIRKGSLDSCSSSFSWYLRWPQRKVSKTTRLFAKERPLIQVSVGSAEDSDDHIVANLVYAFNTLLHDVPNELNNIKGIYIKYTMSKPVKVEWKHM